ncbi:hypothetical protein BDR07DRAFT_1612633 [Suillus spraguei]|nr:hypothetical protein BDR07DRAFT_1612633 [Suillus spraguei]
MATNPPEGFDDNKSVVNAPPPQGEVLRRSLGCPPDEIEVHETGSKHQFIASFRIGMFQKRLRVMQKLNYEFVAGGRIWYLHFDMDYTWKWRILFGLSSPSTPVGLSAFFWTEDDRKPGCKSLHMGGSQFIETVVPRESNYAEKYKNVAGEASPGRQWFWAIG